jgi:nucleoside phosphorylase
LYVLFHWHVKEMETAAVASVAKDLFAVPAAFALKTVTDTVDGERATPTPTTFLPIGQKKS